jgi:transcriptional regulator with XRE-family HTH domain
MHILTVVNNQGAIIHEYMHGFILRGRNMQNLISKRLMERRKEIGYSRKQLGDMVHVSESMIYRYETERNDPTAEMVYLLAKALSTSADYLLGLSEGKTVIHPTRKKYVLNLRPLLDAYHRLMSLDNLEIEIITELRAKSLEVRQKALDIIKLL